MGNLFNLYLPFLHSSISSVNVHWHLGTEHLSIGEYDETGKLQYRTTEEKENANLYEYLNE